MRVALVSPDPDGAAGGVERLCTLLAGVLADEGHEPVIVGPAPIRHERWVYRLGLRDLARSRAAARSVAAVAPGLVISNGMLGARGPWPRIHVYHGTMVGHTLATGALLSRRERLRRIVGSGAAEAAAGRGATVVAVSDFAAAQVRRYYRVGVDEVIPNGVDAERYRPRPREEARARLGLDPDERFALFAGRVEWGKGSDVMVEGVARGGMRLLVAGPHAPPEAVDLGVLGGEDLAAAYAAADCVLMPSRYEGCSYVVLEALATGVPLVTTRVGWVPELLRAVPGYEALCVEPSVQSIAHALSTLEERARPDVLAAARAHVLAHNSLQAFGSRWRELVRSVVA
jgi:glycosyltransferase involved in cell wall biosynthesis